MTKDQTQGRRLIALLKKNSYTTLDMVKHTGISVCPWKRVVEQLRPNEELKKVKHYPDQGRWYYVYRVVAKKG